MNDTDSSLAEKNVSGHVPSSTEMSETQLYDATETLGFKVTKYTLYILIVAVSTAGNSAIIGVILSSKRMRSSAGNILILALALHDLLTPLLSIPFDLALEENKYVWSYGYILCKLLYPLTTFTATCSSLILAAISLDRYRTMLHPFKRKLSIKQIKGVVLVTHFSSALIVSPYAIFLELRDGSFCVEMWPDFLYRQMFTVALFLIQYLLPLIFMIVVYVLAALNLFATTQRVRSMSEDSDSKLSTTSTLATNPATRESFSIRNEQNTRATKMFVVIVTVFAICTLPNEVLWLWIDFAKKGDEGAIHEVKIVCRFFTYTNSCLNPLIFCKFRREFRRGFINILRWMVCKFAKKGSDLERFRRIWGIKDAGDKTHLKGQRKTDSDNLIASSRRSSVRFSDKTTTSNDVPSTSKNEQTLCKRCPRTGILENPLAIGLALEEKDTSEKEIGKRNVIIDKGILNVVDPDCCKTISSSTTEDALKDSDMAINFAGQKQLRQFRETTC